MASDFATAAKVPFDGPHRSKRVADERQVRAVRDGGREGGLLTFAAGARLSEVCSGSGHSMGGEIVRPFCSVSVRPVRSVGKHSNSWENGPTFDQGRADAADGEKSRSCSICHGKSSRTRRDIGRRMQCCRSKSRDGPGWRSFSPPKGRRSSVRSSGWGCRCRSMRAPARSFRARRLDGSEARSEGDPSFLLGRRSERGDGDARHGAGPGAADGDAGWRLGPLLTRPAGAGGSCRAGTARSTIPTPTPSPNCQVWISNVRAATGPSGSGRVQVVCSPTKPPVLLSSTQHPQT